MALCENKRIVGWHLKEQNPRLTQVRFFQESWLRIVRVSVAFLVPCPNFPLFVSLTWVNVFLHSCQWPFVSIDILKSPQSSVPVNQKDGHEYRYKEISTFEMRCFSFSSDLMKWLPFVVYTVALSQLLACDRFYHGCFRSGKCFYTWLHVKE